MDRKIGKKIFVHNIYKIHKKGGKYMDKEMYKRLETLRDDCLDILKDAPTEEKCTEKENILFVHIDILLKNLQDVLQQKRER